MRNPRSGFPVLERIGAELHRPERHVPVDAREPFDARGALRHVARVRGQHLRVRALWTFELFAWRHLENTQDNTQKLTYRYITEEPPNGIFFRILLEILKNQIIRTK